MSDAPDKKDLVGLLEQGARGAMDGLGRGLGEARAALAAPEGADIASLVSATDLPELASGGALGAIATRLDREADLHRGVALRELARVAWMDRVTQMVVVAAAACELAIAASATFLAFVGASLEGRGALFLLAAAVVATAAGLVATVSARSRVAHVQIADDALARARAVEDRLFRVALAQQWRSEGALHFQDALARLEGDARAPRTEAGAEP